MSRPDEMTNDDCRMSNEGILFKIKFDSYLIGIFQT